MAQTKKTIWTRWYMIVLYVFVGLMIIGALLPDSNNSQTNTNTQNPNSNLNVQSTDNLVNQQNAQTNAPASQQISCTPDWQCGSWSACSSSEKQTRECSDENNCGTSSGKPQLSKSCTYTAPVAEEQSGATIGEKNALSKAQSYLDYSAFSYSGLIKQLKYEGFTTEQAEYAVDNCGADWNEQATLKAKSYLDYSAFSYNGLVKQLKYEGFTQQEAEHGVDNSGANWNEQAALKAQSYLDYSAFSREGLINQLEYEGFTTEQAEYGVKAVGY
jgi:SOS response regulatory protein OraA/RecX